MPPFLRKTAYLTVFFAVIFTILHPPFLPSAAQSTSPLQGPLIVTASPEQDGFWLIDLADGQTRWLSFGTGDHFVWDFSPDGCQLLFSWERSPGNSDLFIANLDGSGLQQVMELGPTGALNYRAWEADWSPDGSRIVFTLIRYYDPPDKPPYRDTHIAWVNPQGSRPNFYSNSGKEVNPRWSGDGKRLVYVSYQPLGSPDVEGTLTFKPELWLVNADGSNKHRLTDFGEGGAANPRWSPDDKQIAFIYEPSENNHQVMVMTPDGSPPTQVLNRQSVTILDFTWQTDAAAIVLAAQDFEEIAYNILWVLPLDEGENFSPRRVLTDPSRSYFDYPRFSADGRWLAFRRNYHLSVIDRQSGETVIWDDRFASNSAPLWSPATFQGENRCDD